MSTEHPKLWIGSVNGALIVHDPSLQLKGSLHVAVFMVRFSRIDHYKRTHIRGVSRGLEPDHSERPYCLRTYGAWRSARSQQDIQAILAQTTRLDEKLRGRYDEVRVKHRAFVTNSGYHHYAGAELPMASAATRDAHCRVCAELLISESSLECLSCHWIVCSSCGACGC